MKKISGMLICLVKGHDKVFLPKDDAIVLEAAAKRHEVEFVPWACKRCGKHPWWMWWW